MSAIALHLELHDAAHGFRRDRSIVTNATPHVGADVIINFDLKNFFPSISYKRVKGLFHSFGYSEAAATIFGLVSTAAEVETLEIDGKTYYVAVDERHLPLFQIEKDGLEGKHWGNSDNLIAAIGGFANFVAMVNPEKGAEFQQQVQRIKKKYVRKGRN